MCIEAWLRERAGVGPAEGEVRHSPSGAVLLLAGNEVVKLHRAGTDGAELAARLRLAGATPELLGPLAEDPQPGPDGRWATRWPRVTPLLPDPLTAPWREAAELLAALHARPVAASAPAQGAVRRRDRSLRRLAELGHDRIMGRELRAAVDAVRAAGRPSPPAPARPVRLVHGDWHLGQLGRVDGAWRLLDVDDVGVGDPAWDLGRPAGFWAAGLLPDGDWYAFLDGYRAGGGPAVPATGDPWPALEPAARAAVVQAAATGVTRAIRQGRPLDELDDALVTACARMLA